MKVEIFSENQLETIDLFIEKNTKNKFVYQEIDHITREYLKLKTDEMSSIFSCILGKLIDMSSSQGGYIIEKNNEDYVWLDMIHGQYQISDKQYCYQQHPYPGDVENLYSLSFHKGIVIISNNPNDDPRSKNIPDDHPILSNFVSFPLFENDEVVASIALVNNDQGYTLEMISDIYPLITLLNSIFIHSKYIRNVINQQSRNQFLSRMSHNLRTPLSGIIGMTQLLSEHSSTFTNSQKKYLQILTQSSLDLLELINDILDYTHLKSGKLTLKHNPIDIRNTIQKAFDMISSEGKQKQLEMKLNFQNQLPKKLIGDESRLIQVLHILMKNAIKFTQQGSVQCHVSGQYQEDLYLLHIAIQDTGIGISPEHHENIFDIFTKIDENSGSGLGLSICKELILLMNGNITVESQGIEGQGTTFHISILFQQQPEIDILLEKYKSVIENKQVILLEPDNEHRIVLNEMMFHWNLNLIPFSTQIETEMYLKRLDITQTIILIINLDSCSSIINSIHSSKIKVIGLTNDEKCPQWDKVKTIHYQPIIPEKLFMSIVKCFTSKSLHVVDQRKPMLSGSLDLPIKPQLNTTPRQINDTEKKKNIQIIIAEDNEKNCIMMKEFLRNMGYRHIDMASNGKDCYEMIKKKQYHICFMDIIMPQMDGFQATAKILNDPDITEPPIIIATTACASEEEKQKCFEAGMKHFLPKPILKNRLEQILNKLI